MAARLANAAVRGWDGRRTLAGRRLRGRHAVIVGYGSIGREAARLLDAFGVRITAVKRDPMRRADTGFRSGDRGLADRLVYLNHKPAP